VLAVLVAMLLIPVGIGAWAVISGNYQVRPVLSGSMRPGFPVGGVVITKRVPTSALQVRDVIVFHRPGEPQELVVHRIVSLRHVDGGISIRTRGDANDAADPWHVTLRGATAYRAVYTVPLVGYAAVWAHNPSGRRTLLILGGLLVLSAAAHTVLQQRRRSADASDESEEEIINLDDAPAVDQQAALPRPVITN
jgi:signal peptidase I